MARRRPRKRWSAMSLIQQLGIIAGTVTALAGSVGAVLALGNDAPPPKPHPPRATLTIERFEKSVTLGQFAARYPEQAPKHLTPAQRERSGGVAELHIVFHNFEGRRCALSWTMFDGANDSPLGDPGFVRRPAGEFKLRPATGPVRPLGLGAGARGRRCLRGVQPHRGRARL